MPKVFRSMSQESMIGSRNETQFFDGDIEDLRVQKFQNRHSHLLIAAAAHLSHQPQPLLASQFLLGDALGDVQKFLRDQTFELAKRLLLENPAHFLFFVGLAFAKDQLTALLEQRPGRLGYALLQLLLTLQIREPGKFAGGQLQELADLVVDVGAPRRRRSLPSGQKLRDVGFGDLSGGSQISLIETQFAQTLFYD